MGVENEIGDIARFGLLSPRHKDCLRLSYRRRRTKEIAAELGLSPGTVSTYCTEAIRLLGARDRRDAAERLHAWEVEHPAPPAPPVTGPRSATTRSTDTPSDVQPPDKGVVTAALPQAAGQPAVPPWARLLPFRHKDDPGNELSVLARLFWIIALTVLVLVGFGAGANGLRTLSDIVRALGGR